MKPEGQAQGCIFRWLMVINPLGDDKVRMWPIIPFLVECENLAYSSPSNHM